MKKLFLSFTEINSIHCIFDALRFKLNRNKQIATLINFLCQILSLKTYFCNILKHFFLCLSRLIKTCFCISKKLIFPLFLKKKKYFNLFTYLESLGFYSFFFIKNILIWKFNYEKWRIQRVLEFIFFLNISSSESFWTASIELKKYVQK